MHIDEVTFCIFDTETTGLDPKFGDRIIEIAAAKIKGNVRSGEFASLIKVDRDNSPAAFAVNGISTDMLIGAPLPKEVMPKFLDFCAGSSLCAYNAGFDLGFLENELEMIGLVLSKEVMVLDILKMARRLMPGLERYALWFVAQELGIKEKQEHRAMSDVEISVGVFERLKNKAVEKGISDFETLCRLFSINKHFLESQEAQRLAEIEEAIELGVRLKIRYLSSSNATVTVREVAPKSIKKENNRNYIVADCLLAKEERTFRLDGILHLEIV